MLKGTFIALAFVMASVGVFAGSTRVSAHARLSESSPAAGEVLQTAPSSVAITFTNDIQKIAGTYGIEVVGVDGVDATAGEGTIDDDNRSVLAVLLRPSLSAGRYVVTYTNVSDADGDPFEGGFAFYVGVEPTAEQLAADALLDPPEAAATQTFVAGGGGATATPGVSETAAAATPSGGSSSSRDSSDDGGNDLGQFVFAGVVVVVAATVGFVIWRAVQGQSAGK